MPRRACSIRSSATLTPTFVFSPDEEGEGEEDDEEDDDDEDGLDDEED